MRSQTILIKGAPIAKKRPRFARRGKFTVAYNDQQTEEGRWLWEAKPQILHCFEGPLQVDIQFYLPRPKGHYGTGRNADQLKPSAPVHHTSKPDKDNLEKFVLDCLNGIAFKDDSQVVQSFVTKHYAKGDPKTIITITEVE